LSQASAFGSVLARANLTPQKKEELNTLDRLISNWTPALEEGMTEFIGQVITVKDEAGRKRTVGLACTARLAVFDDGEMIGSFCTVRG